MTTAIVIMNEQHQLMAEQRQLLDAKYESWDFCKVPASGWTLAEQQEKSEELASNPADKVIASPVPYLLMRLATTRGKGGLCLFHNDKREKKELPGGRIINVVAQTGWQLVTA